MQSKHVLLVGLSLLGACGAIAGDPGDDQGPGAGPDAAVDDDDRPDRPPPNTPPPADAAPEPEPYLFEESLRGSTTGTMLGGTITSTGWRVTARTDRIYWSIPPLREGAIEFTVTGMSNTVNPNMSLGDEEIFTMYEAGFGAVEPVPYFHTFRNNYYKVVVRVSGSGNTDAGEQELIWQNCAAGSPGFNLDPCPCSNRYGASPSGGDDTWDGSGERFRVEWNDTGSRLIRNGVLVVAHTWTPDRAFAPSEHHFSLGTARAPSIPESGLPIGAVFSDVVVEGTTGSAPVVCSP